MVIATFKWGGGGYKICNCEFQVVFQGHGQCLQVSDRRVAHLHFQFMLNT